MTIEGEEEDELYQALDQVAVFQTTVYADDDRVWQAIPHPADELVIRASLGDRTVFQLYNEVRSEVLSEYVLKTVQNPEIEFEKTIESIYNEWRDVVL